MSRMIIPPTAAGAEYKYMTRRSSAWSGVEVSQDSMIFQHRASAAVRRNPASIMENA